MLQAVLGRVLWISVIFSVGLGEMARNCGGDGRSTDMGRGGGGGF